LSSSRDLKCGGDHLPLYLSAPSDLTCLKESEASFLITSVAVTDLITSGVRLHLECIEIDATTNEANWCKNDNPAQAALPYIIDSYTIDTISQ
jgi:hypothetical protein